MPRYEVGRLIICNIDDARNAMEVSDICNLLIFYEVIHEIERMTGYYIILFVYQQEGMREIKRTKGCVWCYEATVRS